MTGVWHQAYLLGQATTIEWGCSSHDCKVTWPIMAPGTKRLSTSILLRPFRSRQWKPAMYAVLRAEFFPYINRCYPLQVDAVFFGEHVALHEWWRHNGKRMYIYKAHDHVKRASEQRVSNEHISQVWEREFYHKVIVHALNVVWKLHLNYTQWKIVDWGNPHGNGDDIFSTVARGLWAYNDSCPLISYTQRISIWCDIGWNDLIFWNYYLKLGTLYYG